jgi:signal transduction histidine kinase
MLAYGMNDAPAPAGIRLTPRTADALIVIGVMVVSVTGAVVPEGSTAGRLARLAPAVVAAGALWWRRRHPVTVLAVVSAMSLAITLMGGVDAPAAALTVALYTVASRCPRRTTLLAAAAAAVVTIAARLIAGGALLDVVPSTLLLLAAATALGLYVGARRAYTERLAAEAVTSERTRIAREVHDVVAHGVTLMVVQAGALRRRTDDEDPAAPVLDSIVTTGREALAELRGLLGVLRAADAPAERSPNPGIGDLAALTDQLRANGLDTHLVIEGAARSLPAGVELAAFRIVQEALTNVVRHAGAQTAEVTVRYEPDRVVLSVVDDGGGPVAGAPSGHGLAGMRERAALYGGEVAAGAGSGGGFEVEAWLPV